MRARRSLYLFDGEKPVDGVEFRFVPGVDGRTVLETRPAAPVAPERGAGDTEMAPPPPIGLPGATSSEIVDVVGAIELDPNSTGIRPSVEVDASDLRSNYP
jgi:hypothetical protein